MSSQRKKRSVVQGGWATNKSKPPNKPLVEKVPDTLNEQMQDVKIDEHKGAFTFETPVEMPKQKPEPKIIRNDGTYELSINPKYGKSEVILMHNFIEPDKHDAMYERLLNELPWEYQYNERYEKVIKTRQVVWYGDVEYIYSGIKHEADSNWHPVIREILEKVVAFTDCQYNSVLCNLYHDGRDHIPWHSDDERCLGNTPTICSITFGALRMFEFKERFPKDSPLIGLEKEFHVPLDGGTLCVMKGATQKDWLHRVPVEYHDKGPRINLTFRKSFPCTH